jgi:phosphatidate phosphatase APP1
MPDDGSDRTRVGAIIAHVDWLILRLKQRFNWLDEVNILPYRGYGTPDRLFLRGRVVEKKGIVPSSAGDSRLRNFLNMYRRFTSSAVAEARVRARFGAQIIDVETDHAGYFDLCLEPCEALDRDTLWQTIDLTLIAPPVQSGDHVSARGAVLVPPADAQFGVISDIDDTVIESSATQILQMLRVVLFRNAHTRLPFHGVAQFYQALQKGGDGHMTNPIFYVSSSPWNIYDLLVDFLDIHGMPVDPLFLRDWSSEQGRLRKMRHLDHKRDRIATLLDTYPHLRFLLIGDSGQEDPEVYQQIVHDYPERILAIYIRNVTTEARARVVCAIAEDVLVHGVDMLLVPDTVGAAEHAASRGYIMESMLPEIREGKAHDEQAPTLLEHVLDAREIFP